MRTATALLALLEGVRGGFVGGAAPSHAAAQQQHHVPALVATASLERVEGTTWEGEELVRVPQGVLRENTLGRPWVDQRARPRRNRKTESVRKMVRENILTPSNFIYPLFIHDESSNVAIASMPGCERHSLQSMVAEAKDAYQYGVRSFVVFPKVPDAVKTVRGEEEGGAHLCEDPDVQEGVDVRPGVEIENF